MENVSLKDANCFNTLLVGAWGSQKKNTCSTSPFVVYFDQLSGAACTRKLVETFFKAVFQPFLFISKLFQ